jgi:hypothetical protein
MSIFTEALRGICLKTSFVAVSKNERRRKNNVKIGFILKMAMGMVRTVISSKVALDKRLDTKQDTGTMVRFTESGVPL